MNKQDFMRMAGLMFDHAQTRGKTPIVLVTAKHDEKKYELHVFGNYSPVFVKKLVERVHDNLQNRFEVNPIKIVVVPEN